MKSSRLIQAAVAVLAICAVGVTANVIASRSDRVASASPAKPAAVDPASAIAPGSALNQDHVARTAPPPVTAASRTQTSPPRATAPIARHITTCSQIIDVDLTTQQLVASSCGRVAIATPITSGRPGLRTPTGAFELFLKEQDTYFYSPWPQGDPNYYSPMFVAYAMEFLDGGYFLHTDPDEPSSAFGAGSEDGPYASHGCVHVPISAMASLYSWAGVGTIVRIHY